MDRDIVKLQNALTEANKALLRQPICPFRLRHQSLYAEVRDAVAELNGDTSQDTQEHFDRIVSMEDFEEFD